MYIDKVLLDTLSNTIFFSLVHLNSKAAYTMYSCGTTSDKFIDYFRNVLALTLHDRYVVVIIMDNIRTHHLKEAREIVEELKINVIYLPPL